jgi:hypothetical protein
MRSAVKHLLESRVTTALRTSKGRSLILATLCVTLLPAVARAQFSAQPVILGLAPVDSATAGTVMVRNEGKEPIQFRFRMADFDQTGTGDHYFQPLGTNAHSCKGRVDVYPGQATLLAGERQEIRVRMLPGKATCWGVLFVEQRARNTVGVMVAQQIAVKIYGTRPEIGVKGGISTVTASPDTSGVSVAFDFKNDGEGPVRPSGTIEIRTPNGDVVASESVDSFSVLPGHSRLVTVAMGHKLKPGRYVAVPVMDFGADYLAGGQATFAVP